MSSKKQFVVLGLGRFGGNVVKTLVNLGYEVLAVDENPEIVKEFADIATSAVQADATDEATLRALGIRNFDVAVVSMAKNLEASILATTLVKELGVPYVISKAENELHGRILEKVGADRVVYPERDMALRTAYNLVSSNILDYLELSPEYSILEVNAPSRFVGKKLGELELRSRYGINVIAIKRGLAFNISPEPEEKIQAGDVIIVIGKNKNLNILRQGE